MGLTPHRSQANQECIEGKYLKTRWLQPGSTNGP